VIPIAAGAAIVGDNIGYTIDRRGARTLLLLPGPFRSRREAVPAQGEPFFERHGPKAVFLGRWTAVLRIAVAWLAGAHRMRWPVFSLWNALGAIAWATVVGLLAYLLGDAVERSQLPHFPPHLRLVAPRLCRTSGRSSVYRHRPCQAVLGSAPAS
jgi:membrane protein DedA with SNARE-associated domain